VAAWPGGGWVVYSAISVPFNERRPRFSVGFVCLDIRIYPKVHYEKGDFLSHQNVGKCMEY
jgi:hypothetical protein